MRKKLSLVMVFMLIFMMGCANSAKTAIKDDNTNSTVKQEVLDMENAKDKTILKSKVANKKFVKFFYPDKENMYWLIKEKEVETLDLVDIVDMIIKDENNGIPKEAKTLSVDIKDRIAYVNLSKDFLTYNLGHGGQYSNVASIINTLCLNDQFNIDKVKFLIDGNNVELIGPIYNSEPFSPTVKLTQI